MSLKKIFCRKSTFLNILLPSWPGKDAPSGDQGSVVAGRGRDNALDHVVVVVFENRSLDNVLGTPHIGYVADDLYRTFYGDTVKALDAWLTERAKSA